MLSFKERFHQLKPAERFCDIYTLPLYRLQSAGFGHPGPGAEVVVVKEEGSGSITRAWPSGTILHKCWVKILGLSQWFVEPAQ